MNEAENNETTPAQEKQEYQEKNKHPFFVKGLLLKVILIAILTTIAVFELFSFFGLGFGCGLGVSRDFDCRVLTPLLGLAFLAHIILVILIGIFLSFKPRVSRVLIIIYFVLLAVVILSFQLYSTLPKDFKLTYLEGYTEEACAKGGSIVPWGRNFSGDECYYRLDMCDKINNPYYRGSCFFDGQLNLKPGKINSMEECSIAGEYFHILACERHFAVEIQDYQYCEGITRDTKKESISFRHTCFNEIAGEAFKGASNRHIGTFQNYVIYNKYDDQACEIFEGIRKDVCLFWMMEYAEGGASFCDQMTVSEV